MKKGKGILKRSVLLIMAFSIAFGISCAAVMGASASETPVSTFDDGYQLNANWIWADTEPSEGQWISLRKTFTLDRVPSEFIARISADTKYWLWINGDLAVFEGQLKLGDSRYTWYYDKIDLKDYLTEGENTIAVQVFYSGKTSASTINTRVPSFLFDAVGEGYSLVSDASWKATLDPAYEEPISLNNERNGEANIKYNAAKKMIDSAGNKWTDKAFDDSAWANAVIQDEKIRTNRIYDDSGNVSGVYYQDTDPRTKLVLRSIPAIKVDELKKYTADDWTVSEEGYVFAPLSLPDTYTVEAEIIVAEPSTSYSGGGSADAAIGLCVCVADVNNFYMPQISFTQGTSFNGVRFKPHTMLSGSWTDRSTTDLTNTELGKSLYVSGSLDRRFNTKHTVKIEVAADTVKTYLNGYLVGTIEGTKLAREGSTIGFRQDRNELINLYSLKVTDTSGTELYNAGISNLESGDTAERFSLLKHKNTAATTVYNTVSVDANGNSYIAIRNCRAAINDGKFYDTYVITNETNIQGTPYIKVKSPAGGELISMVSDSWNKGTSSSIAHQYITKAGEQSWEALGWMNGYKITFTVPKGVEVLELGFRRSGYDTEATGSVTTDSETLNKLYKEAYDTLIVCMRDSYMDCPDRERTQWLGDAVINMQQAAYALDDNAALLYKKTLTQAIGFVQKNGAIPSKIALGRPDLELPMQSLAGVHSFWQYYMYYGDKELVTESYPVLLNYLKLWDVSDSGVITHRDGNWNWYDWGSHPDTVIIENCWYYEALKAVLNIAKLEGSGASAEDIELLEGRMTKIENSFDTLYWNEERNAYYNETDNTLADDRANAMAIYTGLADPTRYEGVLNVLKNTYNSGPYMEKYVLEAMYMMGADDEALARTLERFSPFLEDGYPTLPEIWLDQTLYGGDETKNHAWTGAPISMLYMYNAGITPISPAFESIRIRPQLGSLTSLSAAVERASGRIELSVSRSDNEVVLAVTVPAGVSEALIYVPRLENDTKILLGSSVIYAGGAQIGANMPTNIYYEAEDTDFIAFSVPSGTYTFKAIENTASEGESNNVTFNATEGGSLTVNGSSAGSAWSAPVLSGESISVTATPSEGYRLVAITGSLPESITTSSAVTRTYTPAADMNITFVFEKAPLEYRLLSLVGENSDVDQYALKLYINGEEASLPFKAAFLKDSNVNVYAFGVGDDNYSVTINGEAINELNTVINENTEISIGITENSTVNKKKIQSVTVSKASANDDWLESYIIDGQRISSGDSLGYSTGWSSTDDVSANPYVLTFDLGSLQTINQVSLFPRSNSRAVDSSLSCNFPTDFTIAVSSDGVEYNTVVTVKNGANPKFKQQCYSFTDAEAQYVKLTVTKLGLPAYEEPNNYRLQLAEFEVYYNGESDPTSDKTLTLSTNSGDMAKYGMTVYVNGAVVSLPYEAAFAKDTRVKITAKPSGYKNYAVTMNGSSVEELDIILFEDKDIVIDVAKLDTAVKIPFESLVSHSCGGYDTNNEWKASNLIDGKIIYSGISGHTTGVTTTADVSKKPYVITFDLGSEKTINQISLYPRMSLSATDTSLSAGYPKDFTVAVSLDGVNYTKVVTVIDCETPLFMKQQCYSFNDVEARYVQLSVTKLGMPASNESAKYRLQLSEVEVYYNSALEKVATDYGNVPGEYSDSAKYPVVVFNSDKTFVGAYSSFKKAASVAGIAGGGVSEDRVILFRNDVVMSNANSEGAGNINSFYNNVIIDLGGHTVTLIDKHFLPLYLNSNATEAVEYGTITLRNGKFINSGTKASITPVRVDGGASVAYSVTYNVDFEKVTFTSTSSTSMNGAISTESNRGTANIILNSRLTDCVFDFTGASSSVVMINVGTTMRAVNATVVGGEIIAQANGTFKFFNKDDGDSVVFEKNNDGDRTVLSIGKEIAVPSIDWIDENGNQLEFVKREISGAITKYMLVPTASFENFTPEANITLDSNLIFNIYLPTTKSVVALALNGEEREIKVEDGYYVISESLKPYEAAKTLTLEVTIEVEGTKLKGTFTFSVANYANTIISGEGYSTEEQALAKDMLSYVRACYNFFVEANNASYKDYNTAEEIARVNGIIGEDTAYVPTGTAKTPESGSGFSAVTFYLGDAPAFRFYYTSASAPAYSYKIGNYEIPESDIVTGTDTNGNYVEIKVYAYQLISDLTFTDGNTTYTYNVYSYYAQASEAVKTLVGRLIKYSESAKNYRDSVIDPQA